MHDARRRLDELKVTVRGTVRRGVVQRAPGPARLEEILGGSETTCAGRRYWLVETPFHEVCERHGVTLEHLGRPFVYTGNGVQTSCDQPTVGDPARAGRGEAPVGEPRRASRVQPLVVEPRRTMVLDIETGGFAGVPVFLIGLVPLDRWPLQVVQLLARDYPEEEAILHGLAELAGVRDTWVTFNGKSFDEPFVRDRATLHRVPQPPPRVHVDLLHAARRQWRGVLPNCRLGTVEEHILRRPRVGDVPSSDIPELFHHFMRTGHAGPLRPVLAHNRIDLVSCTELLIRLSRP